MSASILKTATEVVEFFFHPAPMMQESALLKLAHCIIMYLYKELYSSTFDSSLQGELNHTVSC